MSSDSTKRTAPDDEIDLVLLLSNPRLRPDEVDRLAILAGRVLDWNRVLGMLLLHRTAAQAWANLVDHGISQAPQFRPYSAQSALQTLLRSQSIYVREQIARNVELIKLFDAEGIPCAIMKGSALARLGYPRLGARTFTDNDFLFHRDHIARVGAVLKELGYIQGDWDPATATVKPASRSQILLHPVTSHETYPYELPTPEATILESHCVDVHFSVDLMTANRDDDAVSELLSRRVRLAGNDDGHLWALDPVDMFVFLCVHYQREAGNLRETEWLRDLLLYKIVDLLVCLDNPDLPTPPAALADRARSLGFEREVFFGLSHLAALYPDRVPDGLAETLRPAGPDDFLHQITHNGQPVHTWSRPVADRFFDPYRLAELARD